MNFAIGASEMMAGLSLLIASLTYWSQREVNKRQAELNEHLLAKEIAEKDASRKADLGATLSYVPGTSSVALRVFNRGRSAARNVKCEFTRHQTFISVSELKVFPVTIDPQQGVSLRGRSYLENAENKVALRLTWDDDYQANNVRTIEPTLD